MEYNKSFIINVIALFIAHPESNIRRLSEF